jgi:hypothetical protein
MIGIQIQDKKTRLDSFAFLYMPRVYSDTPGTVKIISGYHEFWLSPAKNFFRRVTHHTRLKDMKQDSLFKITEL